MEDKRHSKEAKEKNRLAHLGNKNPRWKGGISQRFIYQDYWKIRDEVIKSHPYCSFCNKTENIFCHHIDGNPKNNILNNLLVICRSCHNKIHSGMGGRIK